MKRGYLIVGAVGVGLILIAVIFNFVLSFGASRTASRFLDRLSAGDARQAYQMTTEAFQRQMKAADFSRMTRRWDLRGFSETEDWESQPGNGQVLITTNVRRKNGTAAPLILKLSKENGDWRIVDVQGPPPPHPRYFATKGFGYYRGHRRKSGPKPPLPATSDITQLVRVSLLDLDRAVKEDDFNTFRSTVAQSWQEEMSVNVFERVLGRIDKNELDISGVANLAPRYEPAPEIGEDALLNARGKYLLGERALDFHLTYTLEGTKWKLLSFWVGLRPSLPDEAEDEPV